MRGEEINLALYIVTTRCGDNLHPSFGCKWPAFLQAPVKLPVVEFPAWKLGFFANHREDPGSLPTRLGPRAFFPGAEGFLGWGVGSACAQALYRNSGDKLSIGLFAALPCRFADCNADVSF